MALQSVMQAVESLLKGRKKGTQSLPGLDLESAPPEIAAPLQVPVFDERADNQSRITKKRQGVDDLLAVLNEAPPVEQKPQLNPIEQLLEVIAVNTGGASNIGAAGELATGRADAANKIAFDQYGARVSNARAALPFLTNELNSLLDRETSLDQIEGRIKQAEIQGQAKEAVQRIKADKDMRFKIGQLIADGKATVPAIAQVLMGSGADAEVANATAEAILRDVGANPISWQQQFNVDRQKAIVEHQQSGDQQKSINADVAVLEDLGASQTLKIAAAGRLIAAGYLPPNADPVAIANEISDKAKESQARTALTNSRNETQKIEKQIKEQLYKQMPREYADRHAKALAQIDHWRNMETLEKSGLDFKMAESARDNLVNRYGKALDSLGRDITTLTNDIISLRDKRKSFDELILKIQRKGTRPDGSPIAANKADQADLDAAWGEKLAYDKNISDKLAIRNELMKQAQGVRDKVEEDGAEDEVGEAMKRYQTPEMQRTQVGADAPPGGYPTDKNTGQPVQKKGSEKPFAVGPIVNAPPAKGGGAKPVKAGSKGSKWGAFSGT